MSEYMFENIRPIARDLLGEMLQKDAGKPSLQIRLYYWKDARRRGLKLSIHRVLVTDFGFISDVMNRHNGIAHLADMPRKPSPKVAAEWAARITAQIDRVAEIALASETPDWKQIAALFTEVPA